MTPACWLNKGFVRIRELIQPASQSEGRPSVLGHLGDGHERWTEARDAWLHACWHFLWADATIEIGEIGAEARTITTGEPYDYGGRGMSNDEGIVCCAFSLLGEIDQLGEWYLDRGDGIPYL